MTFAQALVGKPDETAMLPLQSLRALRGAWLSILLSDDARARLAERSPQWRGDYVVNRWPELLKAVYPRYRRVHSQDWHPRKNASTDLGLFRSGALSDLRERSP